MKKYEEYKDSGVEWLGEIPSHWELSKFKHVIKYSNSGEVIDKSFWNEGDELLFTCSKTPIKSSYNEFPNRKRTASGDILLTRNGTPYIFIPPINSIYSNVVQRIILNKDVDIKFTKYMLESASATLLGNGDIIASFNMDLWSNLNVLIPTLEEQQQIASYLDYKTSKMDELISKKEELVETLKNTRQKLISETVTKGLDKDVKMKNSGVEWIGEIPEHWEIKELKYLLSENITDGPHETPEFLDEGISFLSVDGIINGELNFKNCRKISLESHNRYSKKCKPEYNNILFGKSASVGKVARVKTTQEFSVWSPLALIKLDESSVEPGFIEYFLKSDTIKRNIMFYSTFNTQQNISMDKIKRFKIIVPPLKEQLEVLNFLELRCLKIDELISKTEKQIEILKKAKQSLITEVVTGKIDVRGWTK